MMLLDVNVLLHAFRRDAEHHTRYLTWLEDVANGSARFGLSDQVLSSVARIATHPKLNARPSALSDVFEFLNELRNADGCVTVESGPRHWEIFESLCRDLKLKGNLIPDAWFAALALEGGYEWITTDRDFSRFPKLRWRHPFDG